MIKIKGNYKINLVFIKKIINNQHFPNNKDLPPIFIQTNNYQDLDNTIFKIIEKYLCKK